MRLSILILIFLIGCNTESKVEPILSLPSVPESTKPMEDSLREEKIRKLIDTIYEIKIDKTRKCNLTEGYYVLKNDKIDSADLILITKHLAHQLYISTKRDKTCEYRQMTSATIYLNMEDYRDYEGNYITLCSINPEHPDGDMITMPHKFRKLKQSNR